MTNRQWNTPESPAGIDLSGVHPIGIREVPEYAGLMAHEGIAATPHADRVPAPRSRPRPGIVRLISANPLALPELHRLALASRMKCRTHHLNLGWSVGVPEIRVPRAAVIVLDTFSTGAMTEKVVTVLRTQQPRAGIIALVNDVGDAEGFALLRLGVKGIVSQRDLAAGLGKTIALVARGGVRLPRGLMSRFLDSGLNTAPSPSKLSHRERQVLKGVARSHSNKEIAQELHISESTVKFHLARIFRKYRVRRRAELIVQCQEPLPSGAESKTTPGAQHLV